MKIELTSTDNKLQYQATNLQTSIEVGANRHVEENEKTFRPMELLLTSLTACSAIDIELILEKQKQDVQSIKYSTSGIRKEEAPTSFKEITIDIEVKGNVNPQKLERAIKLTKDKYCSVFHCLHPEIAIEYKTQIIA